MRRPLRCGRRTGRAGAPAARNHRAPRSWVDTGMGYSIAAQPGDRHTASRTSPTARRARMRWCEPHRNETGWRRCCGARICRGSVVRLVVIWRAVRIVQAERARNHEPGPVSQTRMIEVVTVGRQYSPQKKFPIAVRNFRNWVSRMANPGCRCRWMSEIRAGSRAAVRMLITSGHGRVGVGAVPTSLGSGVKGRTGRPFDVCCVRTSARRSPNTFGADGDSCERY
ncbi:hypothetical protein SHJGH_6744 [Streptomyces hygroscopicus subsp. jinggangensis TL01]|nr:hypothetical protein SHJGH_6744 [Streptomyces hygroscopicus subsp. jinggangensis TL01]